MTDLVSPFPPDIAALRADLVARRLPAVWELDPESARALHLEGNLAARSSWQPALDDMDVDAADVHPEDAPPMRVYRRRTDRSEVVIAWFHGGGWVLGGLETADATCRTICAQTGHTVASVDYRCAPWHPFPAAPDDCIAATRALLEHHDRVVVGGDSAGGTLAAMVAQALGGHPCLVRQLLVYPATDPLLRSTSATQFVEGPFLTWRDMEWFYDQYLPGPLRTDPRADLTRAVGAGARVPAVVVTVGHDPLRDEGIDHARALVDAGGEVAWIHAPELYHGALTQTGWLPSAAARLTEVLAALDLG